MYCWIIYHNNIMIFPMSHTSNGDTSIIIIMLVYITTIEIGCSNIDTSSSSTSSFHCLGSQSTIVYDIWMSNFIFSLEWIHLEATFSIFLYLIQQNRSTGTTILNWFGIILGKYILKVWKLVYIWLAQS